MRVYRKKYLSRRAFSEAFGTLRDFHVIPQSQRARDGTIGVYEPTLDRHRAR